MKYIKRLLNKASQRDSLIFVWDAAILITILGWILHYEQLLIILFIPYLLSCFHYYKVISKEEENIYKEEDDETSNE